jgi:hypothetical protein
MVSQAAQGGTRPGGEGMAGTGAGLGTPAAVAAGVLILAGLGYAGWTWRTAPGAAPPPAVATVVPDAGAPGAPADDGAPDQASAEPATAADGDAQADAVAGGAPADPQAAAAGDERSAQAPRTGDAPQAPAAPDVASAEPAPPADGVAAVPGAIPDAVSAAAPDAAPQMPDGLPPAFDTVRVEADGSSVIAGTSAPGSRVRVLVDGSPVA